MKLKLTSHKYKQQQQQLHHYVQHYHYGSSIIFSIIICWTYIQNNNKHATHGTEHRRVTSGSECTKSKTGRERTQERDGRERVALCWAPPQAHWSAEIRQIIDITQDIRNTWWRDDIMNVLKRRVSYFPERSVF